MGVLPDRGRIQPCLHRRWHSATPAASDLGDDAGLRLEGDAFASAASLAEEVEILYIFNG